VAATEPSAVPESNEVFNWRRRQLLRAGYDRPAAKQLAEEQSVDLHQAIELVRRGCPPATAVRILL
jgi:hypothetical protein